MVPVANACRRAGRRRQGGRGGRERAELCTATTQRLLHGHRYGEGGTHPVKRGLVAQHADLYHAHPCTVAAELDPIGALQAIASHLHQQCRGDPQVVIARRRALRYPGRAQLPHHLREQRVVRMRGTGQQLRILDAQHRLRARIAMTGGDQATGLLERGERIVRAAAEAPVLGQRLALRIGITEAIELRLQRADGRALVAEMERDAMGVV